MPLPNPFDFAEFAPNRAHWHTPLFGRGHVALLAYGDWLFIVAHADDSATLFRITGRPSEGEQWIVSIDPARPDDSTCPLAIRQAIDEAARGACHCRSLAEHAKGTCSL